jgi:small GTP-binding protein
VIAAPRAYSISASATNRSFSYGKPGGSAAGSNRDDALMSNANRAILLTPPGATALAVVRISGPLTREFLRARFSREPQAGKTIHGELRDAAAVIDDPVVVLSPDGDWADISLHGGTWVVHSTLQLARRFGFDIIEHAHGAPVPVDAIDASTELECEILSHLPLATTELAMHALLAQEGAWRALQGRDDSISWQEIDAILGDRALEWLLHPPRVAIIGAPNVGKSTLANRLFAQERSITADVPGTTRDWVGELANLNGLTVELLDTPGVRDTPDDIERCAIAASREQVGAADLVVLVLDASRPDDADQRALLEQYAGRSLLVWNKADLARGARPPDGIETIATTGHGIDRLMDAIQRYFGCDALDLTRPRCWTQRQLAILRRSHDARDLVREI